MIKIMAIATILVLALSIVAPALAEETEPTETAGNMFQTTSASVLSGGGQDMRTFVIGTALAVLSMIVISSGRPPTPIDA